MRRFKVYRVLAALHIENIKRMVGPVAFVAEDDFLSVVQQAAGAIVAYAHQGLFSKKYHYITNAFGLTWYCQTPDELRFGADQVLVRADVISVPQ